MGRKYKIDLDPNAPATLTLNLRGWIKEVWIEWAGEEGFKPSSFATHLAKMHSDGYTIRWVRDDE